MAELSKIEAGNLGMIAEKRVSTGIRGLDSITNGGFKRNSVNLVAGGPGSGKTTLGMQFLVHGIENHDEPGLYVSFEQDKGDILADLKAFNWNLEDKIKRKKLIILSYTPEQVEKALRIGGGIIKDTVDSIGAKRIVFDSLTAYTLLYERLSEQKRACVSLFRTIKKWRCTALLIAEQNGTPETHLPSIEEFGVDGVLRLYNFRKGFMRKRMLEVFKMRGTKHPMHLFSMSIGKRGVNIAKRSGARSA